MGAQIFFQDDFNHYIATGNPNVKTPSITKYTVKVKMDDGETASNPINKATFHAPVAANGEVLKTEAEDGILRNADARLQADSTYSPGYEDTPTAFRTLAGVTVPFTVGNNRVPEWGVEDIDFEKSKIQVWYSPNLQYADSFDLVAEYNGLTSGSAEQSFTFPETLTDGAYKTGTYKIVVVLKTLAFDNEDTCDAGGSFVFRVCAMDPTEDGGIHSVYITETKKLTSEDASDGMGFQVLDGDMDSAAIGTYTVPVIRTVPAEGDPTNAYFIPFFTYQNQYVNNEKREFFGESIVQLKVWADGEEPKWLSSSLLTLGNNEPVTLGFTFAVVPAGTDMDGISYVYESNSFTVDPGDSVTIYMQEYYTNGEAGTIRQFTVTMPVLETAAAPTVDVSCATGVPSSTVSINVKDISSLNGMGENSNIHVAPGGLDGWSTDEWYEAAVESVTEEMTREVQDEAGGSTTETVTYTRSLLSIQGNTVLGDAQTRDFLQELIGEYSYANPVIIAVDDAYNVTVREVDDLVTDWDPNAPSVSLVSSNDSTTYTAYLSLSENFIPNSLEELKLYITTVDPETEAGDPAAVPTRAVDTIVIPFSELVKGEAFTTTYDGSTANTPGVYSITVDPLGEEDYRQSYGSDWTMPGWGPDVAIDISVTVKGVRPATPVYFYCVDELGQRSDVETAPAADSTARPEVEKDLIERDTDGSLKLTFTQPVVLLEPEVTNAQHKLETVKTGIPIYSDGNYTVKYMDIFGKEYEEQITVALDGDFKFTTSFVPGELTNQDVTFRLDTQAGESGIYTTVTKVEIPEGTGEVTTQADHQVIVTMRTNGVIKVTLQYGNEPLEKIFPVTFIDKKLDDVKITWEYDANAVGEDGVTIADYVTAVVTLQDPNSDEELIGTEGELRYTFPNNSKQGAQHIFKYKDAAGNEGSITATLDYNIVLPIPPRLTGYGMKVSHTAMTQTYDDLTFRFTAGAKVADGDGEKDLTPPDFKDIFTDPDTDAVIPAKEVIINLSTEIDADIYILGPGAGETDARNATEDAVIEGVTHAGKNVIVSKNTGFTIAIVEKQETVTAAQGAESEDADKSPERKTYLIPVTIENIAVLKEVAVHVEKKSTYEWRAYFDPQENTDLVLTNVRSESEVLYDEERGMFYHLFRQNGTYTFTYRDSVGNTGSIEAEVTGIPAERFPAGEVSWWTYQGAD